MQIYNARHQGPRGLTIRPAAARLLGVWFEFRRGHGYFSLVSVVCFQVKVSAMS